MFKYAIIGQYLPGDSTLHKMDARAKLIAVVVMLASIFAIDSWSGYGVIGFGMLLLFLLSGVPLQYVVKGLYPIMFLIAATFLLHAILTKEGDVLFSIGAFSVYDEGVKQGVFIGLRLLFLIATTLLLTLTTNPIDLTDGMEQVLGPFKKIGMPVHEIAFMMAIAIRFIPTLFQETEKILKAQMARGADFNKGNLRERGRAVISLLVPLFISAFKRAEDLATAMEARGYDGGENRTRLRQLSWKWRDTVACIVAIAGGAYFFFF